MYGMTQKGMILRSSFVYGSGLPVNQNQHNSQITCNNIKMLESMAQSVPDPTGNIGPKRYIWLNLQLVSLTHTWLSQMSFKMS